MGSIVIFRKLRDVLRRLFFPRRLKHVSLQDAYFDAKTKGLIEFDATKALLFYGALAYFLYLKGKRDAAAISRMEGR